MAKPPPPAFLIIMPDPDEAVDLAASHEEFERLLAETPRGFDKQNLEELGELGKGAFGTVHKVRDRASGTVMARKQMPLALEDSVAKERMMLEIRTLAQSHSPFIVQIRGAYFDNDERICILMEYMAGGSLERIYKKAGGIREPYLGKIVYQILSGMDYLKEKHGVMHRDIKPQNFLMNKSGKSKLADLGIGKKLENSVAVSVVGTEFYLAPERIEGSVHEYNITSDVWALGISIVEMATGRFPYDLYDGGKQIAAMHVLDQILHRESPQLDPARFSKEACDFVRLCLLKNPVERPKPHVLLGHPWMVRMKEAKVDMRSWLEALEHPLLCGIRKVVEEMSHVIVRPDALKHAAGWLAATGNNVLGSPPSFGEGPLFKFPQDQYSAWEIMDFYLVWAALNFGFTDAVNFEGFRAEWEGSTFVGSDALAACFRRALASGVNCLDGAWMAAVTEEELGNVLPGIPQLARRVAVLHELGAALVTSYEGRFHNFIKACNVDARPEQDGVTTVALQVFSSQEDPVGRAVPLLMDRLYVTFPSFNDIWLYPEGVDPRRGLRVAFQRRAQLLIWALHCRFSQQRPTPEAHGGSVRLHISDVGRLTATPDVWHAAAMRMMGILVYSEALAKAVDEKRTLRPGSREEVEIRAATVYAMRGLVKEINLQRPADRQVTESVLDSYLWTHYHESHVRHHLCDTASY